MPDNLDLLGIMQYNPDVQTSGSAKDRNDLNKTQL